MSSKSTKLNQIEAYNKASKCIKDLYESINGSKFIHHLIQAYSNGTITYILYSKNKIYDCVTGSELDTIYESKLDVPSDIRKLITDYYNESIESSKLKILTNINNVIISYLALNPRHRVAIRSNLSNKILGIEEFQALKDFIIDQIKIRNKTIIKIVRQSDNEFVKLIKIKHKSKLESSNKVTWMNDDNLRSKLESILDR